MRSTESAPRVDPHGCGSPSTDHPPERRQCPTTRMARQDVRSCRDKRVASNQHRRGRL